MGLQSPRSLRTLTMKLITYKAIGPAAAVLAVLLRRQKLQTTLPHILRVSTQPLYARMARSPDRSIYILDLFADK